MRFFSTSIAVIGCLWFADVSESSETLNHWVQLGPDAELVVRAITRSSKCPTMQIDGRPVAMSLRAEATQQFPGLVCERHLPRSQSNMVLDGRPLATLNPDVRRIAVIGDTGCRIRGTRVQACNNPDAWPLNAIMAEIVAQKPDLVIHVGDYIYRQSPCPPSHDCLGSPYGDNLQTWLADWFGPAQHLLSQVPFVFIRGNHEECGRGAQGWFRYLAVGSPPAACPAASDPWKAQIAGVDLIVFDASDGPAAHSATDQLPVYKRMAHAIFATLQRETWFLTHRPLWAHMRAFDEIINGDDTQREAFGAAMPQAITLVLSGHLHAFQALDMAHGPAQVISGNSGTLLDPMPTGMERDLKVAGSLARQIVNDGGFGFLMLTRTNQRGWHMDVLDAKGERRHRCHLLGRDLSCPAL